MGGSLQDPQKLIQGSVKRFGQNRINHQRKAARTGERPTLHRILFGHQQRQFIIEHKIAGGEAMMIDKRVFDHVDIGSAQGSEKPFGSGDAGYRMHALTATRSEEHTSELQSLMRIS